MIFLINFIVMADLLAKQIANIYFEYKKLLFLRIIDSGICLSECLWIHKSLYVSLIEKAERAKTGPT